MNAHQRRKARRAWRRETLRMIGDLREGIRWITVPVTITPAPGLPAERFRAFLVGKYPELAQADGQALHEAWCKQWPLLPRVVQARCVSCGATFPNSASVTETICNKCAD